MDARDSRWRPVIARVLAPWLYLIPAGALAVRGIDYLLDTMRDTPSIWRYPSGIAEQAAGYGVWGTACLIAAALVIAGVAYGGRKAVLVGTTLAMGLSAGLAVASIVGLIAAGDLASGYRSITPHATNAAVWGLLMISAAYTPVIIRRPLDGRDN